MAATVVRDLTRLLDPGSVAVVGATDRPGSYAQVTLLNLATAGFRGRVRGIHPTRDDVLGVPCVRTIDEAYDAVVIATPAATVPEYLAQAHAAGCGGAVVYAAGFAEAGRGDLQAAAVAAAGDLPIIGPNGNGVVSVAARAPLWGDATRLPERPGPVAVITQSGNIGVLALAHRGGFGLNCVLSLGNAANVDASAALADVARRGGVRAIALYLEGDGDGARLAESFAVCAEHDVRIAILKVGRSERSRRIGAAHTAALAGDDRVFAALVREAGGVLVTDVPELLEVARGLATLRRASGGLVVATASGGDAAVAADIAADLKVHLADVAAEDDALKAVLPHTASATNPLDHTNHVWADTAAIADIVAALVDRPGVSHAMYIQDQPSGLPQFAADEWIATRRGAELGARRCGVEAFVVATMPGQEPEIDGSLGAVSGVRAALLAVAAVQREAPSAERLLRIADVSHTVGIVRGPIRVLSERAGKEWLRDAGVPVPRGAECATGDEAEAAARALSGPLVLKVCAPDLAHVSDVGGVVLDVAREDVYETAERLLAVFPDCPEPSVLVEEMVTGTIELIVSVSRDGVVPYLLIGRGGALTEVEDDAVILPLPVSVDDCLAGLRRLRCAPLLLGHRGSAPVDLSALVSAITALAVAFESSTWTTVEINPIIAGPAGAVAVDAWIAGPGQSGTEAIGDRSSAE